MPSIRVTACLRKRRTNFSHVSRAAFYDSPVLAKGVEMPVLVIGEAPGMTSEQDDAMVDALDLANNPPAGGRFRLSGPMDGGWRIVSLWESREHFETFLEERLNPAREAAGRPAPRLTFWEIEKVRGYEKL